MEKREYSLNEIFENQILNDLYEIRGDGLECAYFRMYGKPDVVIKSEESENEMTDFIKKTIKDKEIQQQILDKFNSCRDYALEEMTLWDRQYYKLGFLDGMYLKKEIVDSSNRFVNSEVEDFQDTFIYKNMHCIKEMLGVNIWKIKTYTEIVHKMSKIKEKYPKIMNFIEQSEIVELTKNEIKALREYLSLANDIQDIELVETFKLGLKEGWSI